MEGQQESPRLLDQVRNVLRLHHYSIHTERSYVDCVPVALTREEVSKVVTVMEARGAKAPYQRATWDLVANGSGTTTVS